MTQEEILQYNKMCVEFLGWDKTHPNIKDWHIYITPIGHVSYDKMLFHSDWNWIMEVVEAINMIPNPKNPTDTTLSTKRIDVKNLLGSANKKAVVEAINQFLIWYNKNKINELRTN